MNNFVFKVSCLVVYTFSPFYWTIVAGKLCSNSLIVTNTSTTQTTILNNDYKATKTLKVFFFYQIEFFYLKVKDAAKCSSLVPYQRDFINTTCTVWPMLLSPSVSFIAQNLGCSHFSQSPRQDVLSDQVRCLYAIFYSEIW